MIRRKSRLVRNRGGASLKTLFIFMVLMVLFAFLVQVFMLYSTCNTIKTAVQRSVMSIASVNKPMVFESLREGNTYSESADGFITSRELKDNLIAELGLSENGNALEKLGSAGNMYYCIKDLSVTAVDMDSKSYNSTLCFVADFTLEISVSSYWNFGNLEIPMRVESSYKAKY